MLIIFFQICSAVIRSIDTLLIVVNIAYAVFAALRMFALYSMRKSILALVLAVGLLNPCTQIFLMCTEVVGVNRGREPIGTSIALPVGRINCYHSIDNTLASSSLFSDYLAAALDFTLPALRCHALMFEGLLIGLTLNRTVTLRSLKDPVIRTPFTTALLRNGTLYFLVIATASMLNMVGMWVLILHPSTVSAGSSYIDNMILALASLGPIVDTITSVCMSRFILNLIVISLDEGSSYARSSQWKTLHFATVAESVATFGADLPGRAAGTGSTTDGGRLAEGTVYTVDDRTGDLR